MNSLSFADDCDDVKDGQLNELIFECQQCYKSYNYRRNLLRHLRFECGVAAKESCDFCSYVTRYKHSLKTHMLSQHSNHMNM